MTDGKMKALMYRGTGDVRVEDIPQPDPPERGELLVRIHTCGICGSDVSDWYMAPRAPLVLGHEPAGEVVAVGEGVTDFAVGDRVVLHHHVPCMFCDACQHGNFTLCTTFRQTRLYPAGMAEYVRIPAEIVARDILKLPDDIPYEAASLIEPVGCCIHTLSRSNITHGDTVVIVGAGFNGVVMAMLAPRWGASRVALLDIKDIRLEQAQSYGLLTFDARDDDIRDQIAAWADGRGPHTVIVTAPDYQSMKEVGYKASDLAFDITAPGGTMVMYALNKPDDPWPLSLNRVQFKEIAIKGCYSAGPHDTRQALALMMDGVLDVSDLITHRFPLSRADEAWHLAKAANDSLKIVVDVIE